METSNNIIKMNNAIITISKDRLEAYLYLFPPVNEEKRLEELAEQTIITEDSIYEILEYNRIQYGIIHENVQKLVEENFYHQEVLIAKGKKPIDGSSGSYKYLFHTNFNKTPKLLEDGSVDYHSIKMFETVKKGQEIVNYTFATAGEDGIDVTGSIILARKGNDLPEIRGNNFSVSDDKTVYTSNIDGKIEIIDNKIIITNIILIDGNITITKGDIDFNGDVSINGNVETGMTVKATGSVYVNGYVESAYIYAGRDVVLRNGMQGARKGSVDAGGSISGKFFENTTIKAKHNINANAIMNCKIDTEGRVIVSGKYGIIAGGYTNASNGIISSSIGNDCELKTIVQVGAPKDWYQELFQVVRKIKLIQDELYKIDLLNNRLRALKEKIYQNKEVLSKWLQLENTEKINKNELKLLNEERIELIRTIKSTKKACVIVRRNIYPGTKVIIQGEVLHITEELRNVMILLNENNICIEKNEK